MTQAAVERSCEMVQEYYRPSLERWATMTQTMKQSGEKSAKYMLRADGLWDGATLLGKICVDHAWSGKSLATDLLMQEFKTRRKEHRIADLFAPGVPPPSERSRER